MIKNVLILHGTDGAPEQNWFPWLKEKFEVKGHKVWVPELPANHTPKAEVYGDFLFSSDWDFENSIVIGHSSGAVEVLNLLMDERCPQVRLAVCVSAWEGGVPDGMDAEQFADLFPKSGFDFETIKQKAEYIEFVHSINDPYCPLQQAQHLAEMLNAPLTTIENGEHLGSNFTEFSELWTIIKKYI